MNYLKSLLFLLTFLIALPSWALPVKILPLGDSITDGAGYNDPHSSYRDELYNLLVDSGYEFEFVGTRSSDYSGGITLNHDGVPSIRADQIVDGGLSQAPLATKLTHYDIDIVLLHAGTNDIIQGQDNDAATLIDIENIIVELQKKVELQNKNITILVANIIPIFSPDLSLGLNTRINDTWAEDQSTPTSKVILVDQHTDFEFSDYSDADSTAENGVHPNQNGETKMAQKWFETLITQPILANQLLIDPKLTLSAPQNTLAETNFTISATSDSSGIITYASTTLTICTVNNLTVTPLMAGTCNLTVAQEAEGSYTADSATLDVTVIPKTDQTLTLNTSKQTARLNTTFTVSAMTTSGLSVFNYTSTTPKLCTVDTNIVTTLVAGDCKLIVTQAGNANYNPATSPIKKVIIIKNEQTLTFITPINAKVGSEFSINANASSALTVKITSKTPKVCTVIANKAKPLTEGTCTLLAAQTGNASFKPKTIEKSITVTEPKKESGAISLSWLILLGLIGLFQRKQIKRTR